MLDTYLPMTWKNALEANTSTDELWKMADQIKNQKLTYRQKLCKNICFTNKNKQATKISARKQNLNSSLKRFLSTP